jgi:hypothetical protein
MELPAGWDLKTRSRDDGKLDVIGKDDSGQEYKVRTCESGAVTESDIQQIRDADRENYRDRDTGAREYVKSAMEASQAFRDNQDRNYLDDLTEAALPVVRAGLERERSTVGYSRRFAAKFDQVKW